MVYRRLNRYIPIILIMITICYCNSAWGEPVTTIRNNGDPANRVDMVILGDGYTAGELSKYAIDVETAVTGFFAQEPYQEYQTYFNVHRVDVISNESGADHPAQGIYRDTAFDASYDCAGIQRLICVNNSTVNAVLFDSVASSQRDIVLVIVNDSEYGGSGGAVAVASTHPTVVELVLHEMGHSFGLLADEYDYGSCNNLYEPPEPNVTRETNPALIKWNQGGGPPTGWIEAGTPIPTTTTAPGIPGLYEGAKYCPTGLYRPTYNSKMRSLGSPFEQVNEEQLIKRVYFLIASALDAVSPAEDSLTIPRGQTRRFQIEVLDPLNHELVVEWYLDGQLFGSGIQYDLNSANLSTDVHTVEVWVWDPTAKVRYDPDEYLMDQKSWTVQITLPADLNGDGLVNQDDVAAMAGDFGKINCNGGCRGDYNGDGDVDGLDLSKFSEAISN